MLTFDLRWLLFALLTLCSGCVLVGLNVSRWFARRRQAATLLPSVQALLEEAPVGVLLLKRTHSYEYANLKARWLLDLPHAKGNFPVASWVTALAEDLAHIHNDPQTSQRYRSLTLPQGIPTDETIVGWRLTRWLEFDLVFITDMSDQQHTEQQMRLLFSDLAHELRTPLATIATHLEVLRLKTISDTVRTQSWQFMKDETERLVRLVHHALELGRLETGPKQELHLVQLLPLVEQAVAQMTPTAQIAGATLAIAAVMPLPPLLGQPEQLKQVFLNLLDNAIKYGNPGNAITIHLQAKAEGLHCAVCDTGPGIAAEHLPHLTRRFYRAAAAGIPGNGLGLALVAEILRQHQSRLTIESKGSNTLASGEQSGTCVRFILPVLQKIEGS